MDRINGILETVMKFKNGAQILETIKKANKIAGVDTEGQELQNKWQEIENRIRVIVTGKQIGRAHV